MTLQAKKFFFVLNLLFFSIRREYAKHLKIKVF